MKKGTLVIIATVLTIIGLVFLIDSLGITGGVISNSVGETTISILGLVFVIIGVVLFMARGLETLVTREKIQKLFFKDSSGTVKINDFRGEFTQEGLDPNEPAMRVLDEFKEQNKGEYKELAQNIIPDEYIESATYQRDSSADFPLKPNTIAFAADRFLKDWDQEYQEVVHPLLRMPVDYIQKEHLNPQANVYDVREVIRVFRENLPNFKEEEKEGHDYIVKYRGTRFRIFAGSRELNQTSPIEVREKLRRIAEIDIKKEEYLHKEDISKRLDVLRRTIYGLEDIKEKVA